MLARGLWRGTNIGAGPCRGMSGLLQDWVRAMREGDHAQAWAISEQLVLSPVTARPDDPALPYHLRRVWNLQRLEGRHVVVRCYHGLGDTIQFLRFLPELRRRAASVTLEIQPRLVPLLGTAPIADCIVPFDLARPVTSAEADVEIMELSFALRVPPSVFPPPYLGAPPAPLPPGVLGFCCQAGNWDPTRSLPSKLLAPLCEGRDCVTLDPLPSALPVLNPEGCPYDMAQTAALIAGAELIVTVDTMIAHLAGAMGKPTWLLLKHAPDWRWPADSGRSEWYPSMRLYAQEAPGDWSGAVERVAHDLDVVVPRRRRQDEPVAGLPADSRFMGRID